MSRDANMTLKVAKDGSRNYGAATVHFLGEEGAFCVPVIRRRMGNARQFVLRCSVTSPTRVDILAQAIQAELES
jgi:hypothetical protein